jgi:hypothetical protein
MADTHADVKGFDFHGRNLTTACRAEARGEGGMDTDAHGFFKTETANREPREIRENKMKQNSFAYFAWFAVENNYFAAWGIGRGATPEISPAHRAGLVVPK